MHIHSEKRQCSAEGTPWRDFIPWDCNYEHQLFGKYYNRVQQVMVSEESRSTSCKQTYAPREGKFAATFERLLGVVTHLGTYKREEDLEELCALADDVIGRLCFAVMTSPEKQKMRIHDAIVCTSKFIEFMEVDLHARDLKVLNQAMHDFVYNRVLLSFKQMDNNTRLKLTLKLCQTDFESVLTLACSHFACHISSETSNKYQDYVESLKIVSESHSSDSEVASSRIDRLIKSKNVPELAKYILEHSKCIKLLRLIRFAVLSGGFDFCGCLEDKDDSEIIKLHHVMSDRHLRECVAQYERQCYFTQDVATEIAQFLTRLQITLFLRLTKQLAECIRKFVQSTARTNTGLTYYELLEEARELVPALLEAFYNIKRADTDPCYDSIRKLFANSKIVQCEIIKWTMAAYEVTHATEKHKSLQAKFYACLDHTQLCHFAIKNVFAMPVEHFPFESALHTANEIISTKLSNWKQQIERASHKANKIVIAAFQEGAHKEVLLLTLGIITKELKDIIEDGGQESKCNIPLIYSHLEHDVRGRFYSLVNQGIISRIELTEDISYWLKLIVIAVSELSTEEQSWLFNKISINQLQHLCVAASFELPCLDKVVGSQELQEQSKPKSVRNGEASKLAQQILASRKSTLESNSSEKEALEGASERSVAHSAEDRQQYPIKTPYFTISNLAIVGRSRNH